MPLTTSHAAAAWPLTRLFPSLPLAAIVFGSMSPDFEYLVRLAPIGRSWHTVPGLVFYAVPAAILVWLVWRVAVRPSLASVWPPGLAGSISGRGFEMRELALAVPAVMA